MAAKPLIFAMANPDPEITPEDVRAVRSDAIIATGRSDYPNQINNVLGFPYIFRGALDVRASTINDAMKIAAAHALAQLAREDVPDEVDAAYAGRRLRFGPEYIIPVPFDPRLIVAIPQAVAKAAMDSGVARSPIIDMGAYAQRLSARLNPTVGSLQAIFESARANPRRVVFAEGEEEKTVRAALSFRAAGYGIPVLVGQEERIRDAARSAGLPGIEGLEIVNAGTSDKNRRYTEYLYDRQQRNGLLLRDCQRMVNQNRNVFAACMVALGDADALVTGVTRTYNVALDDIARVIESKPGQHVIGLSMVLAEGRTLFIADTAVHDNPTPAELADFADQAAAEARRLGHEPRVALISFANFGNPPLKKAEVIRQAVQILDRRNVDFEYDGEMAVDVALNPDLLKLYPFCRLKGPANVLIMPGLHSSQISSKLLHQLGGHTVLGPMLLGLARPAQIVPMGSTVSEIVTMAALAACEAVR
jgi:malate dehydrogenase (oxaloacetate-decarboxylating)(NADP+)